LKEALDDKGAPLVVGVEILGRTVRAKVWALAIGRITLYMLDTDVPENAEEDRRITAQLLRRRLGVAGEAGNHTRHRGVHALHAMGIVPSVYHMNEGHSAFLSLELIRRQVADFKLDFYSALQIVAAANIFTTHTPVPAGNDAFPLDLMRKYFGAYPAKVGIDWATFASLRPIQKRLERAVLDDDPRAAYQPSRKRCVRVAWPRFTRVVEGCVGWRASKRSADHFGHERHSHQNVDGFGFRKTLRPISARLGGAPDG
jgi:glucan phosphorylase